jgi:hypothetical protein
MSNGALIPFSETSSSTLYYYGYVMSIIIKHLLIGIVILYPLFLFFCRAGMGLETGAESFSNSCHREIRQPGREAAEGLG